MYNCIHSSLNSMVLVQTKIRYQYFKILTFEKAKFFKKLFFFIFALFWWFKSVFLKRFAWYVYMQYFAIFYSLGKMFGSFCYAPSFCIVIIDICVFLWMIKIHNFLNFNFLIHESFFSKFEIFFFKNYKKIK